MNSRFFELENRCLVYRRKKIIKNLAFGAIVAIFLVLGAYFIGVFDFNAELEHDEFETMTKTEELEEADDSYMEQTSDEIMSEELEENEIEHNVDEKMVEENISQEQKDSAMQEIQEAVREQEDIIEKKETLFLSPQILLDDFQTKNTKNDMQKTAKDIEKTFDKPDPILKKEKDFDSSPKIEDALFISKYYYDKKNWKKSLQWSIKASKIDSKSPKPWVMYARAKAKSGDRAIAIKALRTYLSEYYSEEASRLLDEIKGMKK